MTGVHDPISRRQALRLVEGAYLAATTALIWLALYFLPIGGPCSGWPYLPCLLQLRRGGRSVPRVCWLLSSCSPH